MAPDGSEPLEQPNGNKYAEIVGGETPSPFAAVSLLAALGCALIALGAWPSVSDWWLAAAIFGVGAATIAAFGYLGLPGQDEVRDSSSDGDYSAGDGR